MKKLTVFLLCLIVGQALSAANPEGIECTIQYYNQRIYYLNDPAGPVQIQVQIVNNSPHSYGLKIADNRVFNVDFVVTTPTNLRLAPSSKYTTLKNSNQPVFVREIGLQPGEKYGLIVDLQDFIRLDEPGLYAVQARFFPDLQSRDETRVLQSNRLALNLRPEITEPQERVRIEAETGMLIQRESLPPDAVVAYTLTARQKSQWEKFFLYLDLERLYRRVPARERQYSRMNESQRRATLADFRRKLQDQVVDQDIVVIPDSFEILKTAYTPTEGTVLVRQKFRYPDYLEVKDYTYSLERRDRFWIITGYDIRNLGTE